MPERQNDAKYDPSEKVERMNRVFDRLVLPILIFSAAVFIVFAIIPKLACGDAEKQQGAGVSQNTLDNMNAYLLREVLLEDMETNRTIFENGGYTVIENEKSGLVAYIALEDGTQLFDNVTDSSGGRYSAVMHTGDGVETTIRIYSEGLFLVETNDGKGSRSAIFCDDGFTSWVSGGDADAAGVLELRTAQQLSGLVEAYKRNILSLVNSNSR